MGRLELYVCSWTIYSHSRKSCSMVTQSYIRSLTRQQSSIRCTNFWPFCFFGDLSRKSLEKALDALSGYDCITLKADSVRFMINNVTAFFSTRRGDVDVGDNVCYLQCADTHRLECFEKPSYEMTRTVFPSQDNTFVTIDDDIYASRACSDH